MEYNPQKIEKKWQNEWEREKIAHTEKNSKEKFFMVFAYPYPTGFLHTGHMRGFSYSDMIIRFHKLKGYNVFFPTGIHATGNGAIAKARLIQQGDEKTIYYLKENGVEQKDLEKMVDAEAFISYFAGRYLHDYKAFGLLVDDRPFLITSNPIYKKFITWQFKKFEEKGLLKQGEYYATVCENCGAVAVDPSESDISSGGTAEKNEYVLLKFKGQINGKEIYLVAATLRPETVYGQTNLWILPDEEYAIIEINDETWVGCESFAEKLAYQYDSKKTGKIMGKEFVGKLFKAPGLEKNIPVLPAEFIDSKMGTGIVTSVPSDAPHDYAALLEVKDNCERYGLCEMVKDITPFPIIKTEGMADMPAVDICDKLGIRKTNDPRIEQAKKHVYKTGFYKGIMISSPYKGMKVEEAKEKIKQELIDQKKAALFYDLSEQVVCRCKGRVFIKKIDHQWFIDYGKDWLNKDSIEHAKTMKIKPNDFYNFFPNALEWFSERPCARMGRWVGTTLPQDERYVIEAISDSTLYPLFFIISKYQKQFTAEQLTMEFFDYVFLGKGNVGTIDTDMDKELIEKIKQEIEYWSPLDLNLGGKEHKTVHFPPFLKAHVAILNKIMWPKGIFVHGWVTSTGGEKVSKSKGGAEPVPQMIAHYGADVMRLYYANVASPFSDMELDRELVNNYKNRINQLIQMVEKLNSLENQTNEYLDEWLENKLNQYIGEYMESMENYDLKKSSDVVFFLLPNDIDWYVRRGGASKKTLQKVLKSLVQLWMPITPHIAEEIWKEILKQDGLVVTSELENPKKVKIEYDSEEYIKKVVDDIANIIKVAKIEPKEISIYTCSNWKKQVVLDGISIDIKQVMPTLMKNEYTQNKVEQSKFVKSLSKKIMDYKSLPKQAFEIDENQILQSAVDFLKTRFNADIIVLEENKAPENDKNKADISAPLKPGIVIR